MRFLSRLYFCSAPRRLQNSQKPPARLSPASARFRPGRASALSLPARSGARSPLAAVVAAGSSSSHYPLASFSPLAPISITCSAQPLPLQSSTSRSTRLPPVPPVHSRPSHPLPPRLPTLALVTHSRLSPPLPPQPTHSRPSYPPPLYLYIPPQMFHVEHLGSLFAPKKLRTFFCVCWHEIRLTGEECSTWNILPL